MKLEVGGVTNAMRHVGQSVPPFVTHDSRQIVWNGVLHRLHLHQGILSISPFKHIGQSSFTPVTCVVARCTACGSLCESLFPPEFPRFTKVEMLSTVDCTHISTRKNTKATVDDTFLPPLPI